MNCMAKHWIHLVGLLAVACTVDAIAQTGQAVPVGVIEVEARTIHRTVELSGTVTAERAAQLSVATGGLVTELLVDAGSEVERGDVLMLMDAELAELQWRSAEAAVAQARHALADAQRRLQEVRRLAPQQSIAESEVRNLSAEVLEDEAALQQLAATAGYRKGIYDRHWLRAPFAGVVSDRMTDLGEWLNPGQAVLELIATDRLRMEFRVPEDYLSMISADTPVSFSLADGSTQQHTAKVDAVVPVADPVDRTFLLRVVTASEVSGMMPGNSVRATLTLQTGQSGPVVPRDAVARHSDGRTVVWIVESGESGSVARERVVQTGLSFDGLVEILQGLAAGEYAVVQGNESLRSGQAVTLRDAGGY
jgi:membrane fusion protein, multidrug efflux system